MKFFAVLSILLFANYCSASPVPTQDLDGPLEEIVVSDQKHRWTMVPDASGRMHLVDLNPYEAPVEPTYVAEEDIVFILLTRRNPTVGQVINLEDLASLRASNYDPAHETRLTVHGWIGSAGSTVNRNVAAAYFQLGEFNMVTVDWSIGASPINYITARNRVGETADVIARFITFLSANGYIQLNRLHIIGHSLGGQVAGLTGKAVTQRSGGGLIQVIMALDPAGPLFSLDSPNERVAPTDGVYVEVIHTNGGLLGFREPIGQVDVFPNFGRTQPGCGVDVSGQCAHERVNQLHAESINTHFTAHECTSFLEIDNGQCTQTGRTARMGGPYGNVGIAGNFHLTTNDVAPFSLG